MITDTKIRRLFLISKFFLTFFILFFVVCKDAYLFRSFRVARGCSLSVGRVPVVSSRPPVSVFRLCLRWSCSGGAPCSLVCWSWSCVPVVVVCPDDYLPYNAHTYAHARARGFLDHNF